jgi:hypothetical protein
VKNDVEAAGPRGTVQQGAPTAGDDPGSNGNGGNGNGGNGSGGNGGDGNGNGGNGEEKPAQTVVNKWQFFSLGALLLTLLVVLGLAFGFKGDTDSVTGILGATLPSFVAIGGAIFGLKLAHDSGKAAGEAEGKAEGEKGKEEAVKNAQTTAVAEAAAPVMDVNPDSLRRLHATLQRDGSSPAGSSGVTFDENSATAIPQDLLDEAKRAAEAIESSRAVASKYMRA